MDCPEKQLLPLGRQSCKVELCVALGQLLQCPFPDFTSLLFHFCFSRLSSWQKVPRGLLFLVLELLVMTSFLYIPVVRHLEPNIFHSNQAHISIDRYKTSLEILNTAFMCVYLGQPNKACVCQPTEDDGRVNRTFKTVSCCLDPLCQTIHRDETLCNCLLALVTHQPVVVCVSWRENLVSWILDRFWRLGKQP